MTQNRKKFPLHNLLFFVVLAVFAVWIVMGSFPTGWFYDIDVGTGTAVGAKPDHSVKQLTSSGTLENLAAWNEIPFTLTTDTLVFAPLAKVMPLLSSVSFLYEYVDDDLTFSEITVHPKDWFESEDKLNIRMRCFREYNASAAIPFGIKQAYPLVLRQRSDISLPEGEWIQVLFPQLFVNPDITAFGRTHVITGE